MRRHVLAVSVLGLLLAFGSSACDNGPVQRAGEKIDRATDQDKLIGKGPIEKVGQSIDQAFKK